MKKMALCAFRAKRVFNWKQRTGTNLDLGWRFLNQWLNHTLLLRTGPAYSRQSSSLLLIIISYYPLRALLHLRI